MSKQAVIVTAFPKAIAVARTLGVARTRADELMKLMDRVAVKGRVYTLTGSPKKRKARIAKKK